MRRTISACLVMATTIQAGIVLQAFEGTYWFADAIVVGRVVATANRTVDIEVESRLRDRTHGTASRLRVFRYARPSCMVPVSSDTYEVGSRYLWLMRKPYDEGAGSNEHWIIIHQQPLEGATVCIDNLSLRQMRIEKTECSTSVSESLFVDALASFENCFRIGDEDMSRGSYPTSQNCTDEQVEEWSARSPMHRMLATTAKERLRKDAMK